MAGERTARGGVGEEEGAWGGAHCGFGREGGVRGGGGGVLWRRHVTSGLSSTDDLGFKLLVVTSMQI